MPRLLAITALSLAANTSVDMPIHNKLPDTKLPSSVSVPHYTNSLWSGYVTRNIHDFKAVEGRIAVPEVDCKIPGSAASFWVGYTYGNTVEQTGFTAECSSPVQLKKGPKDKSMGVVENSSRVFRSTPKYYAWWMMFGAGGVGVESLKIMPGNIVDYKVAYKGVGKYTMSFSDLTTNQHYSTTKTCKPSMIGVSKGQPVMSSCDPKTVEWVIERPGASPLADFGTVGLFQNSATTSTGKTYPMSHFEVTNDPTSKFFFGINMQHDVQLDKVSNPTANGNFNATWLAAGTLGE
jgi:hypothetical protein